MSVSAARVRELVAGLPGAEEGAHHGHPDFRVRKKIFAFPGHGNGLTVKADREELPALLGDPRFTPARYLARGGWVSMDLTTGPIDWNEIDELIRTSYCLIAPKKLAALATRS